MFPRRKSTNERGYMLVLTAAGAFVLLGFTGLAVDVGYFELLKRRAQVAADAAALGAMYDLKNGANLTTATASGQADATRNGFTNGSGNITVAINNPPLYGAYAGNDNYVEALVTVTRAPFFMAAINSNALAVKARAVAYKGPATSTGGATGCIYALSSTASPGIWLAGSNTVTFNCSAMANSSNSVAYKSEGSITLQLGNNSNVGVVGGYQILNGTYMRRIPGNTNVTPTTITAQADPLASLAVPAATSLTVRRTTAVTYDMNNKPTGNTLQPGIYCGGVTINNTNGQTFTMAPGTYVMAGGGLRIQSLALMSMAGVFVYSTSSSSASWGCAQSYNAGQLNIDGQATVNWSAPTSGTYAGIAFFQDRNVTPSSSNQIVSQTNNTLNGAFYCKTSNLLWSGSKASSGYMFLVANTITINGNSGLTVNNDYSSLASGNPLGGGSGSGSGSSGGGLVE